MRQEQFIDLLDRFGSRQEDWPDTERTAANALLKRSPKAQEAWEQARDIEAFMRRGDPGRMVDTTATTRLFASVLGQLPPMELRRHSAWRMTLDWLGLAMGAGREWGPRFAVSALVAAMLGFVAGGLLPAYQTEQVSTTDLFAMSNTYLTVTTR